MRFLQLPPQINRLLLLIFAIVISYLVARTLLTPGSFRKHGFYRDDALIERADLPTTFAGKVALGERRPEILKVLASGSHKTLSCEGCHGPIKADLLTAPDAKPAKPVEGFCLRCHEANPIRPAMFKQITVKDHYEGKCLECHLPHNPHEAPAEPATETPAP